MDAGRPVDRRDLRARRECSGLTRDLARGIHREVVDGLSAVKDGTAALNHRAADMKVATGSRSASGGTDHPGKDGIGHFDVAELRGRGVGVAGAVDHDVHTFEKGGELRNGHCRLLSSVETRCLERPHRMP